MKKYKFSPDIMREMRKASAEIIEPAEKKAIPQRKIIKGGTEPLPLLKVAKWTLGGGLAGGILAAIFGFVYFGVGILAGSFLAILSLYSLKILTTKVIQAGPKNLGLFYGLNLVRWFLFALFGYLLLKVSLFCLLGAAAGYAWFLGVLAWLGIQSAGPEQKKQPMEPSK